MKINIKHLSKEEYLIPVKIIAVYALWKLFHYFALLPRTTLNQYWQDIVYHVGSYYAAATSFVMSLSGMKVSASGININLLSSNKQIWVQEHCLAIPAMVVFTGAIILFTGSLKDKLVFVLIGLTGIVILNIVRLIFVSLAWVYLSDYFFKLHHTIIYVVAMYGFIFFMLVWWMNRTVKNNSEAAS